MANRTTMTIEAMETPYNDSGYALYNTDVNAKQTSECLRRHRQGFLSPH